MSEEVKETAPASAATEVTTQTPAVEGAAQSTGATTGVQADSTETAYNPNYKFSVMDKEHEIDEWLRPVIKDAEMEKKVKDLYTKA